MLGQLRLPVLSDGQPKQEMYERPAKAVGLDRSSALDPRADGEPDQEHSDPPERAEPRVRPPFVERQRSVEHAPQGERPLCRDAEGGNRHEGRRMRGLYEVEAALSAVASRDVLRSSELRENLERHLGIGRSPDA